MSGNAVLTASCRASGGLLAALGRTFTLVCGLIHGCDVSCISIRPKTFSSLCCAQMLRRTIRYKSVRPGRAPSVLNTGVCGE